MKNIFHLKIYLKTLPLQYLINVKSLDSMNKNKILDDSVEFLIIHQTQCVLTWNHHFPPSTSTQSWKRSTNAMSMCSFCGINGKEKSTTLACMRAPQIKSIFDAFQSFCFRCLFAEEAKNKYKCAFCGHR